MNEALWYFGRGTGIAALVLLTLTMVLGILTRHRAKVGDLPQFALTAIHRRASLIATGLIVLHLGSLFFDTEAQLNAVDLIFPFLGTWSPIWLGFGTLAFDIVLIIVVTSLLRKRINYLAWRRIHLVSYLLWPTAVVHAIGTGTDAATWWGLGTTVVCVLAVLATWLGTWAVRSGQAPRPARVVATSPLGSAR